ncbi:MAG: glycosyltransferase family 2 protein [Anaerolineae bacterium]|nr:glycosyltransferase family 2 protein [Anaerolineae bacterium]
MQAAEYPAATLIETTPHAGLVAIVPAHNEARYIGSVVLMTRKHVETVIVIDDGSEDETAAVAEAAGALVLRHPQNAGKGVALNTGFVKARELSPRVVITLDGDWQHLPEEIDRVIGPILRGDADIVVGSRYLEVTSEVPKARVFGHWGFTSLTNAISGVSLTDSQSGYRAFSPAALKVLVFSSTSFSVESEMQFLARNHKLRVVEVPITIRYLDKPKRSLLSHGWTVLNGLLRLVAQHRPLLFFGLPGFALLVIGLILGLQVVDAYNRFENLAVGTALIVVILLLGGVFFLFTGIILHALRILMDEIKANLNR